MRNRRLLMWGAASLLASLVGTARGLARSPAFRIPKGRSQRQYGEGLKGMLLRVCPGGRHAWFQTAIGEVRKPYHV